MKESRDTFTSVQRVNSISGTALIMFQNTTN